MNIKQKIILIYFLILPFIDLATSLMTRFTDIMLTPGMIIKGITLLFAIIYIFFFSKSKYKRISIIYSSILILYIILYIGLKKDIWSLSNLIKEGTYGYRYFYYPFVFMGFLNLADDVKLDVTLVKKIISYNALIYAMLIIIPYITNTGFASYYDYYRFEGSVGWFYAANEIGAILTILSVSIYYFLDVSKKYKVLLLIPIFASLTILGTKVGFLGMVIVYFICLIAFIIKEKKKSFLLVCVSLCFLGVATYFSPISNNIKSVMGNYLPSNEDNINNPNNNEKPNDNKKPENKNDSNKTGNKLIEKIHNFKKLDDFIKNEKIRNAITVIFNGRDIMLVENLNYYLYSGSVNQLFGLSWTDRESIDYTTNNKLIEIDYFDILIHYGIIGFIIYFLPLVVFLFYTIINIKYIKVETYIYLFTILTILGAALLAGHIFSAPAVSIYLILLMIISLFEIDKNKKEKSGGSKWKK